MTIREILENTEARKIKLLQYAKDGNTVVTHHINLICFALQQCGAFFCMEVRMENQRKFWMVTVESHEDPEINILWISIFSTEEKADAFKKAAEDKLKHYGVFETVEVVKGFGELDDDMHLGWIDDLYSEC